MEIVKGYTKRINRGDAEFLTEEEYNRLSEEYKLTAAEWDNLRNTEDYFETIYCFPEQQRVIYLGWAFYPQF